MARESYESLVKAPESSWKLVARVGLPTRAVHVWHALLPSLQSS